MAGVKGRSGARLDKPWAEALRMVMNETIDAAGTKQIRRLAEACVLKAIGGDVAAMKEIGDRLDGKAAQSIDATVEHSGQVAYIAAPLPETLSWLEGDAGGDQERPLTESLH